jgi:hypothetical protein
MPEFDLLSVVFVGGMAIIAGVVSPNLVIVPLLLALIFPIDVKSASFVGMVISLPLGFLVRFSKGAK